MYRAEGAHDRAVSTEAIAASLDQSNASFGRKVKGLQPLVRVQQPRDHFVRIFRVRLQQIGHFGFAETAVENP